MEKNVQKFLGSQGIPQEAIPDIDLYMDQILGFMEEKLRVYERDGNKKVMTKTMVNNYVKAKVIDRPHKKKYGRDQIEKLIMLYRLKSVLSLKDIRELLGHLENSNENCYATFMRMEKDHLEDISARFEDSIEGNSRSLIAIEILNLSVEADLKKRLAEKLLDGLANGVL